MTTGQTDKSVLANTAIITAVERLFFSGSASDGAGEKSLALDSTTGKPIAFRRLSSFADLLLLDPGAVIAVSAFGRTHLAQLLNLPLEYDNEPVAGRGFETVPSVLTNGFGKRLRVAGGADESETLYAFRFIDPQYQIFEVESEWNKDLSFAAATEEEEDELRETVVRFGLPDKAPYIARDVDCLKLGFLPGHHDQKRSLRRACADAEEDRLAYPNVCLTITRA